MNTIIDNNRLWKKIEKTETCWNWTGGVSGHYGYAINDEGKPEGIHRILFKIFKGDISNGLEIDHLCRNKLCCNPEHLEAVTHHENLKRAMKTHCKNGHELTDDNVTTFQTWSGIGRKCKTCRRKK
jgi:hypothetical protein